MKIQKTCIQPLASPEPAKNIIGDVIKDLEPGTVFSIRHTKYNFDVNGQWLRLDESPQVVGLNSNLVKNINELSHSYYIVGVYKVHVYEKAVMLLEGC